MLGDRRIQLSTVNPFRSISLLMGWTAVQSRDREGRSLYIKCMIVANHPLSPCDPRGQTQTQRSPGTTKGLQTIRLGQNGVGEKVKESFRYSPPTGSVKLQSGGYGRRREIARGRRVVRKTPRQFGYALHAGADVLVPCAGLVSC